MLVKLVKVTDLGGSGLGRVGFEPAGGECACMRGELHGLTIRPTLPLTRTETTRTQPNYCGTTVQPWC
jgi:hypothetical protein